MNLDDWQTDADKDEGWPQFIAAAATFFIVLIALYLWMVTLAAAR